MPSKTILITGGAGFIGSHLADELLREGYRVRVVDSLIEQIHGSMRQRPVYLNREVEFIAGDIRNRQVLRKALRGVSAVYHFAAMLGGSHGMYQLQEYTEVNNTATAVLLEELILHPVERLIVASSMSVYGEGLYQNQKGEKTEVTERTAEGLKKKKWDLYDQNGRMLHPVATPETKTPMPGSVYALSKYDQERLCMMVGKMSHIPAVALRFFNAYGSRQSPFNPYSGVLTSFATALMERQSPVISEDGDQQRDFVSVYDAVHACRLALESPKAAGEIFNIGSGKNYTLRYMASVLGEVTGRTEIASHISGQHRAGEIRHCFADISKARNLLGYEPAISLREGLEDLVQWLETEKAPGRLRSFSSLYPIKRITV